MEKRRFLMAMDVAECPYVGRLGLLGLHVPAAVFHLVPAVSGQFPAFVRACHLVDRLMGDVNPFILPEPAGNLPGRPLLLPYKLHYAPP